MMKLLFITLLFTACTARVYDADERRFGNTQSTYDVWDFEIVSASEVAGRTYRIAVITDRRYRDPVEDVEGIDGLSDQQRDEIPVGQSKRLEFNTNTLTLKSIYGQGRLTIDSVNFNNPIVANVHHVRSCNVSVEQKEKTEIVGDSSKGIITVPKLKTSTVRTYSEPPCADAADRQVEQKRADPPSKEMLEAQKKSAIELAERELSKKIAERAERYDAEFKTKANSITFSSIPNDELHQAFCPRIGAQMSAGDLSEITFARVETKHEEHKGYTEIAYASSVTLKPKIGAPVTFENSDYSEIARTFRSLKLDSAQCLKIEAEQKTSDLRKSADEIEGIIKRYVRDVNFERASKEERGAK